MKQIKRMGISLALCASLLAALVGCGGGSGADGGGSKASGAADASGSADAPKQSYELTVSGIGGSLNYIPVYIAREEGFLAKNGLTVHDVMFTNGPVQMESLSSDAWDLGCTGVGGVLSGTIGYDALLVGASSTDDGTQFVFARNDSDIVKAGKGHNKTSPEIYGTAETWKGKHILCNTGTVLQFLLNKTLEGFGLTQEDVHFTAMDAPTAYSAFLSGEGDICVLTGASGAYNMLAMPEYTAISSGPEAQTGLMTNFVANKNSYADPEKFAAMKVFMQVYFDTLKWMQEHPDESAQYMVDFCEESGVSMDLETAQKYLKADKYYTLEDCYKMMTDKADGQDVTVVESKIIDVLKFFIASGSYKETDLDKFKGHTDAKLITEVYQAK